MSQLAFVSHSSTGSRPGSSDELGQPLAEAAVVVIDLETTGFSPTEAAITEIAAVKYIGSEYIGEFQTLVNPQMAIPHSITKITGITDAMVDSAPMVNEVLPSLLEFIGSKSHSVVGGHNVGFDISFLDAALQANELERLTHGKVDTLAIARELIKHEVPDFKLNTLARYLKVATEPAHRALADARATVEVMFALIQRAEAIGITIYLSPNE